MTGKTEHRPNVGKAMKPDYLRIASRSVACVAAALLAGCSATAPRIEYVGGAASAPAPAPAPTMAPRGDAPAEIDVAELAAKYYGIEAKVEGLVADIETLDQGQAALQMDLRAVEGRIGSAESRIIALTEQILARFDGFEAQAVGLRLDLERLAAPVRVDSTARDADDASTADLLAAVQEWGIAWQNGAVTEYMSWYHPNAAVTRVSVVSSGARTKEALDPAKLRDRMARLRARYTRVEVDIRDVEVVPDGERMIVRFRQDFTAWAGDPSAPPTYADTGSKTLVFVRVAGDWRVIQESWEPTT